MILGLLTRTDAVDTELVSSKVNLMERYRIRPQHHKSIHGPIRKPRYTPIGKTDHNPVQRSYHNQTHRAVQDQNNPTDSQTNKEIFQTSKDFNGPPRKRK